MGNDLSTARVAAPAAFIINLGAQIYGLVSDPNMKQVADNVNYFNKLSYTEPLLTSTRITMPSLRIQLLSAGFSFLR